MFFYNNMFHPSYISVTPCIILLKRHTRSLVPLGSGVISPSRGRSGNDCYVLLLLLPSDFGVTRACDSLSPPSHENNNKLLYTRL